MAFGFLDTQFIDFPPGIDVAYIRGLESRSGVSFESVLQQIDSRLSAFNSALDPLVATLISATTEPETDDSAPVAFEITERGEYTLARPQFAQGAGHMLPLRHYDVALGFTEDGLEAMSEAAIMRQVDSVILGYRKLHTLKVYERLFSNAEIRVGKKTTVMSPGFAGSGTGTNVFNRPLPNGSSLPSGYSHYYFVNTDTTGAFEKALNEGIKCLRKWHAGPFELVGSGAMIQIVKGLEGFTKTGTALVRLASDQAEALVDASTYVGVYTTDNGIDVRVRKPLDELQSPHLAIYRSYGILHPDNPLVWRYDMLKGRNAYVRYRSQFPLDQAVVLQDFGVGVKDRTAAVLLYAASGATAYGNPVLK